MQANFHSACLQTQLRLWRNEFYSNFSFDYCYFHKWNNCNCYYYYFFFTDASVFDYLCGELRRGYLLENDEQRFAERREKFYIFLRIPREIEKVLYFLFYQTS